MDWRQWLAKAAPATSHPLLSRDLPCPEDTDLSPQTQGLIQLPSSTTAVYSLRFVPVTLSAPADLTYEDHSESVTGLKILQFNRLTGVLSPLPSHQIDDLEGMNSLFTPDSMESLHRLRASSRIHLRDHDVVASPQGDLEFALLEDLSRRGELVDPSGTGLLQFAEPLPWSLGCHLSLPFTETKSRAQPLITQVELFLYQGHLHPLTEAGMAPQILIPCEQISFVWKCGLILWQNKIYTLSDPRAASLIDLGVNSRSPDVPVADWGDFAAQIIRSFGPIDFCLRPKDQSMGSLVVLEPEIVPHPILYIHSLQETSISLSPEKGRLKFKSQVWFRYGIPIPGPNEYPAVVHKKLTHPGESLLGIQSELHQLPDLPPMLQLTLFWRDHSLEDRAVAELDSLGLRFAPRDLSFVPRLNSPNNDPLALAYQLLAKNWEVWAEKRQICIVEDFKIQVDQEIDWLDISLQIPGEKPLYGWQLILMLKRRSLFVQLGNGTLGVLPEKWYLQLAKLMNLTGDDHTTPYPLSADGVSLLGLSELLNLEAPSPHLNIAPSLLENLDVLQNQAGLDEVDLPETFLAELRPYQKIGLAWLLFMQRIRLGACLADDMGLGKSVQVIALFETLRSRHLDTPETPSPWPALLVVPRTLVSQWLSECQRFAPQLHTRFVKGRDLSSALQDPRSQVLITTFGAMAGLKQASHPSDTPATSHPHDPIVVKSLVIDEAQKIKNPHTLAYQGMCQVKADWRLALTGTPLENHWYEFFGLFNLLNPNMRRLAPGQWDSPTNENLSELLPLVKPLTLRRLKTEVLRDLPSKREESVFLDMLPKQHLFYNEVKQLCLTMLNDTGSLVDSKSQFQFLEGLLRLRQITCHPDLVFGKNTGGNLEKRVFGNSAKIEFLKILIPNLVSSGRKTVIFSQFSAFLQVIRTMLLDLEIPCLLIDGKTLDRQQVVDTFQTDPESPVLLASIRVGGVGLNLTAADTCILMEPWWNPAVEAQAVDRINRIGQKKSIEVYRLYCKDTIEEKILLLQQSKDERAKMIQFLTDADVAHLSREDFQRLLD